MAKTLIIVRHGNTFAAGQTPTRVGARTDLELVEEKRARSVGKYLKSLEVFPDKFFAAPLKRTMQTAKLAAEELGASTEIIPEANFTEIDYGPDENKTEEEVEQRIGKDAIAKWNTSAIPPQGWKVDVSAIIVAWKNFANSIKAGETVFLCSSNGIIRFAPHILSENYENFCNAHDIKVATGGVCIFKEEQGKWSCTLWNEKPYKMEL